MMSKKEGKKQPNLLEILNSLNQRLTVVEQRITQGGEGKPISQKVRLPTHDLENTAKFMTDAGILDVTNVPVCCACHGVLRDGDQFFVCHHCERVLCDLHTIIFNNRAHCEEDFRREHIDLSRRDYATLICIANGIDNTDKIADLSSMLPEDVEAYEFVGPGRSLYILWSNTVTNTTSIPASADAILTDRDGGESIVLPVETGRVTFEVGIQPVFVEIPSASIR